MDRIEATEKARAILGDNFAAVRQETWWHLNGEIEYRYSVLTVEPMPDCFTVAWGKTWESMIEDLEESMRVTA